MFYLCFFEKSIIINIERNRCFVLQTKNSVKQINRERERERDKSKIWGGGEVEDMEFHVEILGVN